MRTTSLLLLLLSCGIGCYGSSCFPVKEGDSCTLTCKGNKEAGETGSLAWEVERNGEEIFLSICRGGVCYNEKTGNGKFSTGPFGNSGKPLGYTLTIQNVTVDEENLTVNCISVKDFGDFQSHSNLIDTWIVSDIYHPPESVTCNVREVGSRRINITCRTSSIYPGIECEFFQRHYGDSVPVKAFRLENWITRLEFSSHFAGHCSAIVEISYSDILFIAHVYPAVNMKYRDIVGFLSGNISYTSDRSGPIVHLIQPSVINMCPGQPNHLQCVAKRLPFVRSFRWYLNDEAVSLERAKVKKNGINDSYSSTFTLTQETLSPQAFKHKVVVKCEALVVDETSRENVSLFDVKELEVRWPPQHAPRFQHKKNSNVQNLTAFKEENVTLSCLVNGGRPQVSSIRVQCFHRNHSNAVDLCSNSSSLSFTLGGLDTLGENTCICSATHITKCFNITAKMIFWLVKPSTKNNTSASSASQPPQTSNEVIYYAIAGVLGVVFLIVAIGISLKIWFKWPHLYSRPTSTTRTVTEPISLHEYESVSGIAERITSWLEQSNHMMDTPCHLASGMVYEEETTLQNCLLQQIPSFFNVSIESSDRPSLSGDCFPDKTEGRSILPLLHQSTEYEATNSDDETEYLTESQENGDQYITPICVDEHSLLDDEEIYICGDLDNKHKTVLQSKNGPPD